MNLIGFEIYIVMSTIDLSVISIYFLYKTVV
jgi:hypothetical protein